MHCIWVTKSYLKNSVQINLGLITSFAPLKRMKNCRIHFRKESRIMRSTSWYMVMSREPTGRKTVMNNLIFHLSFNRWISERTWRSFTCGSAIRKKYIKIRKTIPVLPALWTVCPLMHEELRNTAHPGCDWPENGSWFSRQNLWTDRQTYWWDHDHCYIRS